MEKRKRIKDEIERLYLATLRDKQELWMSEFHARQAAHRAEVLGEVLDVFARIEKEQAA